MTSDPVTSDHGTPARPAVAQARRVVIKLGTRVLTHDDGRLALSRLFRCVEAAAALRRQGRDVLLVSSGAVGLGREALRLPDVPKDLAERQACAAVGQSRLMGLYEQGFTRLGLVCAQVLLTQADLRSRLRYLNLRTALLRLLHHGVVPIINDNDVVSTEEVALVEDEGRLVFGDNDGLSARVAAKLEADLLVLLTDVPGVFDRPPSQPGATLIPRLDTPEDLGDAAGDSTSGAGRGGMKSKVDAALTLARAGGHTVIASGRDPDALLAVLRGEPIGTWVPARPGLSAKQRWIAFSTSPRGTLSLDPGAVDALRHRGASLLAPGVRAVTGAFQRGDVVELLDPHGAPIGRGIVHCDAEEARAWCAGQAPHNTRSHHALVHRDHLVLDD